MANNNGNGNGKNNAATATVNPSLTAEKIETDRTIADQAIASQVNEAVKKAIADTSTPVVVDYKITKVKDLDTVLVFVGDINSGIGSIHYTLEGKFRSLGEMTLKGIQVKAEWLNATTAALSKVANATWNKATLEANRKKAEETNKANREKINADLAKMPESNPFA